MPKPVGAARLLDLFATPIRDRSMSLKSTRFQANARVTERVREHGCHKQRSTARVAQVCKRLGIPVEGAESCLNQWWWRAVKNSWLHRLVDFFIFLKLRLSFYTVCCAF